MNRRYLAKFIDLKSEMKKEKSEKSSFFELLDLIDFRDDLRYK